MNSTQLEMQESKFKVSLDLYYKELEKQLKQWLNANMDMAFNLLSVRYSKFVMVLKSHSVCHFYNKSILMGLFFNPLLSPHIRSYFRNSVSHPFPTSILDNIQSRQG